MPRSWAYLTQHYHNEFVGTYSTPGSSARSWESIYLEIYNLIDLFFGLFYCFVSINIAVN